MAKFTLAPIDNQVAVNDRFQKVVNVINDKILFRDTTTGEPNTMHNDLDMGDNDVINAGDVSAKRLILNGTDITDDIVALAKVVDENTFVVADTKYWGDPNTDLSMRVRRDTSDGQLIFERRLNGNWVEKFRISDSASVDTMKFITSTEHPIVRQGELGLYSYVFKDAENNNAPILRPVFVGPDGSHFITVAALPDGGLRVPQNAEAAIADPNTPLTYRHVLYRDDAELIKLAIQSLTGDDRLDASAIKNIQGGSVMNAKEIVALLETLTGADRLGAGAIRNLPIPDSINNPPAYYTSAAPIQDITNGSWLSIIRYQNQDAILQTLPDIRTFDNNQMFIIDCTNSLGSVTLEPYEASGVPTQSISSGTSFIAKEFDKIVLVADKDNNNWVVAFRINTEPVTSSSLTVSQTSSASDGFIPKRLNFIDSRITSGVNDGEYDISVCPVLEQGGETLRNKKGYNFVGDAIVVTQNTTNPDFADINFEGSRITVGSDSHRHPNIGFDSDSFELTENLSEDSSFIGFKGIGINDGASDRDRAKSLVLPLSKFRLSSNGSSTTVTPLWAAIPVKINLYI